ncbi:MAG: glutathione S-transferase N-terminal domain-containing protein [Acetobacteraceae bacterium]|nr:glutathione S-transferase N-terminal domain-containing protein [Pseudomonadota bacterium]
MKLYYSATSPYVRKVMACAIIRGLDARIEQVPTLPAELPADLLAANPLSKVPTLVTDDGVSLFGSQLICEYLDSLGEALPLFPPSGAARWRALKYQSLGDGILDAAVPCRGEMGKPREDARDAMIARYKALMARTVDTLEADPPHRSVDIGSITVACALGYLDFRYAADAWRNGHPKLAAWYDSFSRNKGILETAPPG